MKNAITKKVTAALATVLMVSAQALAAQSTDVIVCDKHNGDVYVFASNGSPAANELSMKLVLRQSYSNGGDSVGVSSEFDNAVALVKRTTAIAANGKKIKVFKLIFPANRNLSYVGEVVVPLDGTPVPAKQALSSLELFYGLSECYLVDGIK